MIERQTPRAPDRVIEQKSGKAWVIIEGGVGALPTLATTTDAFIDEFKKNPNILYFGIDLNENEVARAEHIVDTRLQDAVAKKRVLFMRGDLTRIEARDQTADEMVLKNVLGDPNIPVERRRAMIEEAFRVLKVGGLLTVIEDNTPQYVRSDGLLDFLQQKFGFHVLTRNPAQDTPMNTLSQYDKVFHEAFWRPGSFVVECVRQA